MSVNWINQSNVECMWNILGLLNSLGVTEYVYYHEVAEYFKGKK